jgi:hypothetical protein
MKRILFFLLFLSLTFYTFSQEKLIPVVIDADEINYLQEKKKILARKNVKMKYKNIQLFCDEAEYDAVTNIAHIKGNVKIVRKDTIIYGEDIIYDFKANKATIHKIRIESEPLYGEAEEMEKVGATEEIEKDKYLLKEGYITTCDLKDPHYRLVAKKVTIYPQEKVIAKNMFLKVGKIPIFYFPYYSHSLKDKSFPLQIVPGKSGEWGYYLLGRWRYNFDDNNKGNIHTDWYEERGLGVGVSHKVKSEKLGEWLIKYYFIEDRLYRLGKRKDLFDEYPERSEILPKYLEDDRYKTQFSYSWSPTPYLSIRSEFHKFSDINFMKDFFYREYEIEPHPLSYALVDYSFGGSSLSLLVQKRANHFFEETEYLPQLEYNFYRKNLGNSNFYLESKTTLGNLTHKNANSDVDNDALRFHTHNVLSFAKNIKWLYFNPYVGNYTTFYSKNAFGDENITRVAFESGINLSTKLYRIFDVDFSLFGEKIDKIRHILTPQVTYSYIHPPTVSANNLFQFDGIDELERKEAIIFKIDSKFQAKNEEKVWDFVYFSPSLEYQINKEKDGSFFDKIKSKLEIYPKEGISLVGNTEYDCRDRAFKEANIDINFSDVKNKRYSVSFGHRYLRDDSSQSTFSLTYQLTSKIQFKNYLRYEYTTGDFKQQQYILRFDLHCWWFDFGVDIDKQKEGVKDFNFWIIFRLKAFPDIHVGFDHTYHGGKRSY